MAVPIPPAPKLNPNLAPHQVIVRPLVTEKGMHRANRNNAYAFEVATFTYGKLTPEPDGPDEGPGRYGICCDRSRDCDCSGDHGLFNVGTKQHHDRYHDALGEEEPNPPATIAQANLRKEYQ